MKTKEQYAQELVVEEVKVIGKRVEALLSIIGSEFVDWEKVEAELFNIRGEIESCELRKHALLKEWETYPTHCGYVEYEESDKPDGEPCMEPVYGIGCVYGNEGELSCYCKEHFEAFADLEWVWKEVVGDQSA